ncbi:MAG TPA: arsenite methyltransferase [Clostridia bacterium]|nr:arsenite methyltransferase [Clostridia bacterium]
MNSDVKQKVKSYYGGIAKKVNRESKSSCCGGSSCCNSISDDSIIYKGENLENLPIEAVNASLGCANPLLLAQLKEGETVLDLGSGGGIDVLLATRYVGSTGKIYGLDMTDEMLELANKNKKRMGVENVEFIKGYIEDIPLDEYTVDAVISNCVINLSDDKEKALSEAYRVIKKGGRLAISDIIVLKDVPKDIKNMAELWVGCIAGALSTDEYKTILEKVGFKHIEIKPVHVYTKEVILEILQQKNYLLEIEVGDVLELLDGAYAGAYIKAEK